MSRPDRISPFLVYPWILIGIQILMLGDMAFRLFSAAEEAAVPPNPALDLMFREPGLRSILSGAGYLIRLNMFGLAVCVITAIAGKWNRDLLYKIPLFLAASILMFITTWIQVSLVFPGR